MDTDNPQDHPPVRETGALTVIIATIGFLALIAVFVFYCWWQAHYGFA